MSVTPHRNPPHSEATAVSFNSYPAWYSEKQDLSAPKRHSDELRAEGSEPP